MENEKKDVNVKKKVDKGDTHWVAYTTITVVIGLVSAVGVFLYSSSILEQKEARIDELLSNVQTLGTDVDVLENKLFEVTQKQKDLDEEAGLRTFDFTIGETTFTTTYDSVWVYEEDDASSLSTLSRSNSKIEFLHVDDFGEVCVYPGGEEPEGASRRYGEFDEFVLDGEVYRFAQDQNTYSDGLIRHTLCQERIVDDAAVFVENTVYGEIKLIYDASDEASLIEEAKDIIKSIK